MFDGQSQEKGTQPNTVRARGIPVGSSRPLATIACHQPRIALALSRKKQGGAFSVRG
jgi:hypothetical protein